MAAYHPATDVDLTLDAPPSNDTPLPADTSRKAAKPVNMKNVPAFVSKLLMMINDASTDHLISWTKVG